jgi:hypothetical protein
LPEFLDQLKMVEFLKSAAFVNDANGLEWTRHMLVFLRLWQSSGEAEDFS